MLSTPKLILCEFNPSAQASFDYLMKLIERKAENHVVQKEFIALRAIIAVAMSARASAVVAGQSW